MEEYFVWATTRRIRLDTPGGPLSRRRSGVPSWPRTSWRIGKASVVAVNSPSPAPAPGERGSGKPPRSGRRDGAHASHALWPTEFDARPPLLA